MPASRPYSKEFFSNRELGTRASARRILPVLMDLVGPASVVDVGCGNGVWLDELLGQGIERCLGIDGPWAKNELLRIPEERFLEHDLASGMPEISDSFDLAISIEVAEHLPESSADDFVAFLCGLAPVVAFSAAVPMQGGTGHQNERPQSYWLEKFTGRSFIGFDYLRPRMWYDSAVNVVHRQNLMLYVNASQQDLVERLEPYQISRASLVDVIHPELYELRLRKATSRTTPLRRIAGRLLSRIAGLAS